MRRGGGTKGEREKKKHDCEQVIWYKSSGCERQESQVIDKVRGVEKKKKKGK